MTISTIFIANRGEIAVRIIRAAKQLGIRTVQAYSSADADMLAVRLADEAVEIGSGSPIVAETYLNTDAVLSAAKSAAADAIHPGYGFLSENADFADAVVAAGLIFIGPQGDTIRLMGDKALARVQAQKAGVPTVPGVDNTGSDDPELINQIREIGFPVMIKAAAGGGGRGIRIVHHEDDYAAQAAQASAEAMAAFGDASIYVEKLIPNARHIEVQILGDGKDVIHCGERECSLQRRRQKVWEEAPSTVLQHDSRDALCQSAVDLASAVNYRGAGTIEYLYDDQSGAFYFIEMNTRIQVEHPVTEMITGIDLVAEMIRIAGGSPLSFSQQDISFDGHAIEVRINAEDPANNFMPYPGMVSGLSLPEGEGVRFDHMLYDGYTIPPFYDSLLGKLIVHGQSRGQALERLDQALVTLGINGVPTTAPLFAALLDDDDIRTNQVHTGWLEAWLTSERNSLNNPSKGGVV